MENVVKRHKTETALLLLLVVNFLLGLDIFSGIWSFFSNTPPFQWLQSRWPTMTAELYRSLTLIVRLCMLVLLGVILFIIRQQRQDTKRVEELQKELDTFKSTQPYLKAEPIVVSRQPSFSSQRIGDIDIYKSGPASFAFLYITNEPESLNSNALAITIYAKVSYCDEQWNELHFPIEGAWFTLDHTYLNKGYILPPGFIAGPEPSTDDLWPYHSTYLGVALRYSWGEKLHCHALSPLSGQYICWLDPSLLLSRKIVYVKVLLGCSGFRTTYYYVLTDCGPEKGLDLQPLSGPNIAQGACSCSTRNKLYHLLRWNRT